MQAFLISAGVIAGRTARRRVENVPAVYLGEQIAQRLPVAIVHRLTAAIFCALGLVTLFGFGKSFDV